MSSDLRRTARAALDSVKSSAIAAPMRDYIAQLEERERVAVAEARTLRWRVADLEDRLKGANEHRDRCILDMTDALVRADKAEREYAQAVRSGLR